VTFQGIIFDFNGVLWQDSHLQLKAWQNCAQTLRGYDFSDDELLHHMHGRNNQYIISYLLNRRIEDDELIDLINQKESLYRQMCVEEMESFALTTDAKNLLDFLTDHKISRTIATASERKNLDFFEDNFKLSQWFDMSNIVYDDGTLPGKPAPDVYLRAAQNICLEPCACIVVEDAYSGIQAAYSAGVGYIIAMGPQSTHENLRKKKEVNKIIENFEQIPVESLFLE